MDRSAGTVSTKGQVVVPKDIRERRQWGPGTRLVFEDRPEGVLIRKAPVVRPTTIDEVAGMLHYDGPPVSVEDMNQAVENEVRRRGALGRY